MNKLEKLISELIPNGVRYVKLKDICISLQKGTLKKEELKEDGKYPVVNSGRELYGRYDKYNNKNAFTIAARGSAGFINYFENEFWAGGLCYPYSSKDEKVIRNKFIYYYLKTNEQKIMDNLVIKGSIPAINKSDMDKFKIPLPPIEVQNEIVRILDKYTEMNENIKEELISELEMRRKQYEFYLTKITSKEYLSKSKEEIKTKYLGEVVKIKNGKDWKILKQGKVPVYGSGGNMGIFVDEFSYNKETVLIPRKGTMKNVYYLDEPFWNVDTVYYTEINEKLIIPKYLYYLLNQIDLTKLSINSTRPSLTQEIIKKIKLVLPPISVQQEIVNILDKFEKICNSLTEGIPAEIEMRQKQYEYYRNKLFNLERINEKKIEKNMEKIGEKIG